jgi:hypothetical protein
LSTAALENMLRKELMGDSQPKAGETPAPPAAPAAPLPQAPAGELETPAPPAPDRQTPTPNPQSAAEPPAEWPKTAIDVVTALRAERREIQADLEATRQQMKELQAKAPHPPGAPAAPAAPPADPELARLEQEERQHRTVAGLAANLLAQANEAVSKGEGIGEVVKALEQRGVTNLRTDSPEQVLEYLTWLQSQAAEKAQDAAIDRRVHTRLREQALAAHATQAEQTVRTILPELAEANSETASTFAKAMQEHQLDRHPLGQFVAAAIALGSPLVLARLQARSNGQPKAGGTPALPPNPAPPKPPPPGQRLPGAGAALPSSAPAGEDTSDALWRKFLETKDPKFRDASVKAALQGR